jgi:hypothetical protein
MHSCEPCGEHVVSAAWPREHDLDLVLVEHDDAVLASALTGMEMQCVVRTPDLGDTPRSHLRHGTVSDPRRWRCWPWARLSVARS